MSTAKKINDVPTVDIGPSTRILALDSSGAVGKGTLPSSGWQQSAESSLSRGKWYRVADVNRTGVGTMAVMRYYHNNAPRNLLISISFDAFGDIADGIDVRVLAGVPIHITKIRCVVDKYNTAWAGHIDIYVGGGTGSDATTVGLSGLGMRVCDITEAPSIEGANLVKEFDLNSGGVICCTAIGPYLVAYKEKGGPHERWKNPFSYETSGADDGRVGISGELLRLQRHCQSPDRHLSNGLCVPKHSGRGEVGLHDCDKRGLQTRYCNVAYRDRAVPSVGTWIPSIYGADAGLAHPDLTPRKEVAA